MNLASAFAHSAEKNAQKTAVYWGDAEYSYHQLYTQTERVARHLREELDVEPGDRVGLWLRNCPEFIPAIFGVLTAAGVVVPINNFLKPDEVSYVLNDAGAKVLITEAAMTEAQRQLSGKLPELKFLQIEQFAGLSNRTAGTVISVERTESDLAVIIYTSGTTGRPKGAMLSHGNQIGRAHV